MGRWNDAAAQSFDSHPNKNDLAELMRRNAPMSEARPAIEQYFNANRVIFTYRGILLDELNRLYMTRFSLLHDAVTGKIGWDEIQRTLEEQDRSDRKNDHHHGLYDDQE